jgi:predicted Zn finger-like uncharacterized protein
MQVTCPNCGARYAVDPLAIGPVGRIVQCARCANRWLQTVAAAKADAAARMTVDRPAQAAAPSPGVAPTQAMPSGSASPPRAAEATPSPALAADPAARPSFNMASFNSSAIPNIGTSREPEEPFESVPDLVIRPPRERTSLPAVIERPPSHVPMLALAAIGALILVVGIGVAIYYFREPIIAHLPPHLRSMLKL